MRVRVKLAAPALVVVLIGCATHGPPDKSFVVDPRDGRSYPVTVVGEQRWLARNAAYAASAESWCFNDAEADCDINGRLYTWQAALSACPHGWRLATDADWKQLEITLGMTSMDADQRAARGSTQGAQLRKGGASGFDAPISGYRRPDGTYARRSERAAFWTATAASADDAWHRDIRSDVDTIYRSPVTKTYALSVRCVHAWLRTRDLP